MTIALIVVVLLAVFLTVIALQPPEFRVERSASIAAPPATVFPHANDLRRTAAWSPWLKMDPAARVGYEGPPSGVGASSTWVGNSKIGEGRQTIIESRPDELVRIRLDFKKPFESTATAELVLKPAGDGTVVTWRLLGANNFMAKAFCLFMNQDKMIGGSFEEGLAGLKALVESPSHS